MSTTLRAADAQERVAAEIEQLRVTAQAEADFSAIHPKRENPWAGASRRLADAKQRQQELADAARREQFAALLNEYEDIVTRLVASEAPSMARIAAVDAEVNAMGAPIRELYDPADFRRLHNLYATMTGPDATAFAHAKAYHTLKAERRRLQGELDQIRCRRSDLERQYPVLCAFGDTIRRSAPPAAGKARTAAA